ncbi:MAG TPA: GtrA family protein [Draconibacterium sp.]|nr:GtrA family protein [Draconibacterium sp.]
MRNFFEKLGKNIGNIVDWFHFPFLQFLPREIFRYAATGGANTFLDISLYFVFYRYIIKMQIVELGFVAISPHIAAFLMVFPITFTTGFFLAKYVTFTSSELKGRIQLFRYLLTVGGSIFLNYIFLKFFVEYCGLYATLSKVITTLLVVIYSYMAQRFFSFRTAKHMICVPRET